MSSVFIHVGQCGNQLGRSFLNLISQDKTAASDHVYVNGEGKARSVFIDSEPKVVQSLQKHELVREKNVIQGRRGRGANWAMGYHGTKFAEEDSILERALNAIRKEIERCECFSGVIMVHSLCGGTGAGLGSRLVEQLRDDFPMQYLLSCVVAPHAQGESPMQHYNALLCHAWMQRYCDSVMMFENDGVLAHLEKHLKVRSGEKGVSLEKMNSHITQCMGGVFLPADSITPQGGCSLGQEPWEMLRSVCPMPSWKYLQTSTLSKSKVSWENLVGALVQNARRFSPDGRSHSCIASLLVARGDTTGSFPSQQVKIIDKVKQAYNCVHWNPFPVDCWTSRTNSVGPKMSATATIAANTTSITDHLQTVMDSARQKMQARAYLHWYSKYGMEENDFDEAFETIEGTVTEYSEAAR